MLVYDHFGRGFSERPSVPYDKELYVETLRELIESQNIKEKVHLVGYSMGGPIVVTMQKDILRIAKVFL